MKSRPHDLYRIRIDFAREDEFITRYVFGIENVPAARERAIVDCDIFPAYVTVYEWTGKRWWAIDRVSVNGGCMWYDKHKEADSLPF